MPPETQTPATLEDELKTVLARHNELLRGDEGAVKQARAFARAFAVLNAKMMQQDVLPTCREEYGVAHIEWEDRSVTTFVGETANSEWLDGAEIDVSKFNHIEIKNTDL